MAELPEKRPKTSFRDDFLPKFFMLATESIISMIHFNKSTIKSSTKLIRFLKINFPYIHCIISVLIALI